MTQHFDIIIVGGGMVGASLARALAGCGMRIGVIESWPFDAQQQPSYDDRAIALAYGTRLILEGMGLWQPLANQAEPIRNIHVSNRGGFGFTRMSSREHEFDALGYVVSGRSLGSVLAGDLGKIENIQLFCPAELQAFQVMDDLVEVQLRQQTQTQTVSARLLIAADGIRSKVRRTLGIGTREWSYGQTALTCNLMPGAAAVGTAYERFTDTGPMAMLPLPEGRYGLVWTLPDAQVESIMALDDTAFLDRLQALFGYRLGRLHSPGKRGVYPLKLMQARESVRPRVALLGNAAHAVHPVTGQGFNLGIRDVAVLAEVLHDARRHKQDIGSMSTLQEYARWRQRDQQAVALITDGLVRLFTNPLPSMRLLRNLGLLALDTMPPMRRGLARQFMGINGRLPRLARGLPLA